MVVYSTGGRASNPLYGGELVNRGFANPFDRFELLQQGGSAGLAHTIDGAEGERQGILCSQGAVVADGVAMHLLLNGRDEGVGASVGFYGDILPP